MMNKPIFWMAVLLSVTLYGCDWKSDPTDRGVEQVTGTVEPGSFGKYHALIIGINDYKIWPKLKYARRDAENIGKQLTTQYTFDDANVTYLLDEAATLEGIMRALRNKLEILGEKDNLLVYYAGHGQLDPLTETGYWIPVDGKLAVETSWIMFSTLQTLLAATNVKAKNIVLLTDSCYGGAITRGAPTPGSKSPEETGYPQYEQRLKGLAQKRSRQVIASGGADVTVPDRSDFAQLVIDALKDNQYPLTDMEMLFFRDVYPKLRFAGQQDPVIARIAPRPGEDGQFVLVKRGSDAALASDGTTTGSTPRGQQPTNGETPPGGETTTTSPPSTVTKGSLTVQSNVSGDTVFINDQSKGSTPLAVELQPGSHTIRVEKGGYSSYTQRIDLAAGDKLVVKAQLQPLQSPLPIVERYEANTNEIDQHGKATLTWKTKNARSVEIKGVGNVALTGKVDVSPEKTMTYTLLATNAQGKQTTAEVTIKVRTVPLPEIAVFTATPQSVDIGQTVQLGWKTADAESVTLEGVGTVPSSGSHTVKPSQSTRYVLTAKNRAGQTVEQSVSVNVNVPEPKIISFSANKTSITPGETVTLNWRTQHAAEVEISPLGRAADHGSQELKPEQTTTYTLVARNTAGQRVQQAVTVNVGSGGTRPVSPILIRPDVIRHLAVVKIPNPVIVVDAKPEVLRPGSNVIRYQMEVSNWNAYPADFFQAAPDLPPCGRNNNASRTWVDIYNAATKQRVYGYCALSEPKQLASLSFAVSTTANPPKQIYIIITDRRNNKTYQSDTVTVK